ncbi:MAG: VWA domain-containing protein [Candidatus Lernaella stagnicola]|nr:VWA domain-containing protein [Candidatus Lernaella stagnicola]
MQFAHPEVLLALVVVPLYLLAAWALRRHGRRKLAALLPAPEQRAILSTANPTRAVLQSVLLATALLFVVVSAARPQFGIEYKEVQRRGVDVVVAIDVSTSMLARDVVPDRLGQAKTLAVKLLERLGGDRVAVLPFAGNSTLRWPLSFDHGAAAMLIEALDAQAVTRGGSGLHNAVDGALQLFTEDETYEKVLVVFSDGEDHVGGVDEAARRAEAAKMIVHTVGVGATQGVPIPVPGRDGEEFKHDRSGEMVYTRLEAEPLQILAAVSGGTFHVASYSGEEIDAVAAAIDALVGRDLKSSTVVHTKEQYQWFLLPAIILLAVEALLGRRKKEVRP